MLLSRKTEIKINKEEYKAYFEIPFIILGINLKQTTQQKTRQTRFKRTRLQRTSASIKHILMY
jgi:hypothetical protein